MKLIEHFNISQDPFTIDDPRKIDPNLSFSFEEFLDAYRQFDSLFHSTESISITFENKSIFQFIGHFFDH
jgi:hypothetical protein